LPDELDLPGPWNLAAVCHRDQGDSLPPGDARPQYEEAVRLALRSIAVDEASRAAYDRRHGMKSPVPASAADPYRTLASAYLHLGRTPDALAAAEKATTIDPSNIGGYEEVARADLAQNRAEEAAIALAEGMIVTGDRGLLAKLLELYQGGLDSQGCAVKSSRHGPTLNPSCAIVQKDMCEAARRIGRADLRRQFACPNR
jgi:tetratricopeptide (TPR) repeat protein